MRGRGSYLIDVVEAAYADSDDDAGWLRGILEGARPMIDHGLGCGAYLFDARDPSRLRCTSPVDLGAPPGVEPARLSAALNENNLSPESARRLFCPGVPLGTLVPTLEPGSAELATMSAAGATWGLVDMLGSVSTDPSGCGVCLLAPLAKRWQPTPAEVRQWARLSTHIAAGLRLRRQVDLPEAIVEPGGRVVHAETAAQSAAARDVLRQAAQAVDRARGRLRRDDPTEALELWRGLVEGRWSLVDRFESDGRRYLVARRNDPQLPDPRALTLRERQVVGFAGLGHANKMVAYALGLTESSVSTHLSTAMRKLGVHSRPELVAMIAALRDSSGV